MYAGAFYAVLNDEMLKRIGAGITDIELVCSSVLFMLLCLGYGQVFPLPITAIFITGSPV